MESMLGASKTGVDKQWEKVTFVADSGAWDHIVKEDELPEMKVEPSEMSKKGECYGRRWRADLQHRADKDSWNAK